MRFEELDNDYASFSYFEVISAYIFTIDKDLFDGHHTTGTIHILTIKISSIPREDGNSSMLFGDFYFRSALFNGKSLIGQDFTIVEIFVATYQFTVDRGVRNW